MHHCCWSQLYKCRRSYSHLLEDVLFYNMVWKLISLHHMFPQTRIFCLSSIFSGNEKSYWKYNSIHQASKKRFINFQISRITFHEAVILISRLTSVDFHLFFKKYSNVASCNRLVSPEGLRSYYHCKDAVWLTLNLTLL